MARSNFNKYKRFVCKKSARCNRCDELVTGRRLNIHHIDHDRENDSFSNFELLCATCHQRHHNVGKKTSERTRQILSESHKGLPSSRKGVKLTDEQKLKISIATSKTMKALALEGKLGHSKGKPLSEETKKKISNALKGRTSDRCYNVSEETKLKLSLALKLHHSSKKLS